MELILDGWSQSKEQALLFDLLRHLLRSGAVPRCLYIYIYIFLHFSAPNPHLRK